MNSTRCALILALSASLPLAAAGCKKESAEATPAASGAKPSGTEATPEPIVAAPATPTQPAAAAPSGDVVALGSGGKAVVVAAGAGKKVADTPWYTITLAVPAQLGKGAQGTAVLEVTPKKGWKLNKEFPTKLTVAEPAGVKVSKKEQTVADAVAFAEQSARWQVQFEADSSGAKDFTGLLKFAVCTDTSCDPKKEALAWNVAVSD